MRVKYSPLPEARPEMIELLNPRPRPPPRLAAARERRESTRSASRWSLRWKSWSGVLLKERESMWWSWRVAVEVESGSVSVVVEEERESDSGSGHERVVCGAVRGLRSRVWVWVWV